MTIKETWGEKAVSDPTSEYKHGDTAILKIDDEIVECKFVDFDTLDFSDSNPDIKMMGKVSIPMRINTKEETFQSTNDGATSITVSPGYPIIQNPGEPEYPFKEGEESPEDAQKRFESTYSKEEGSSNWVKPPFKVIPVLEPTAIRPSWDKKGLMGTREGGVVAEGGYTITSTSIVGNSDVVNSNYEFLKEKAEQEVE